MDTNNCPIYVPCGTLETYKTAWSDYASRIKYAPLPYKISTHAENGNVNIVSLENYTICDEQSYHYTLTITANYGYHFTQWSDGNLQNPRRVIVSSDTVFSALFDYNVYTLSVPSNDTSLGVTSGAGSYNYLSSVTIEAIPVGNSRFLGWSDGVLDNPRTIVITRDTMLAAHFASNYCNITCLSNDTNLGVVNGAGIYDYLSQALLEAVPDSHCTLLPGAMA
jgi:hypothetical protein